MRPSLVAAIIAGFACVAARADASADAWRTGRRGPRSAPAEVGQHGEHSAVAALLDVEAELREHVGDVLLDGAVGDDQPVGDPAVAPFVDAVGRVNDRAEAMPGFVWRSGDEAALGAAIGWPLITENPTLIASFSVWETPEALRDFVYKAVHGAFFSRRDEWFLPDAPRGYALWWVAKGHVPTMAEARDRVERLIADGPSEAVFTFDTIPALREG